MIKFLAEKQGTSSPRILNFLNPIIKFKGQRKYFKKKLLAQFPDVK